MIEQRQAREKVSAVSGLYTDPTLNSYPIIQAPISVLFRQTKWGVEGRVGEVKRVQASWWLAPFYFRKHFRELLVFKSELA